jgi:hypothetical protein
VGDGFEFDAGLVDAGLVDAGLVDVGLVDVGLVDAKTTSDWAGLVAARLTADSCIAMDSAKLACTSR